MQQSKTDTVMFDERFLIDHPLTTSYIRGVFKGRIVEAFKSTDVPEEMQDSLITAAVDNERMLDILENNPCVLFEMFDDEEVYCYVYPYHKDTKTYYTHAFAGLGFREAVSHSHTTRRESEQCAIKECFEVLEGILSAKKELSS